MLLRLFLRIENNSFFFSSFQKGQLESGPNLRSLWLMEVTFIWHKVAGKCTARDPLSMFFSGIVHPYPLTDGHLCISFHVNCLLKQQVAISVTCEGPWTQQMNASQCCWPMFLFCSTFCRSSIWKRCKSYSTMIWSIYPNLKIFSGIEVRARLFGCIFGSK